MKKTALDFELAWGGYYASTDSEDGLISVFRLLDFNCDAYHAALFSEKFNSAPTLDELSTLSPYLGHVPIDTRALLLKNGLQLVGSLPLCSEDLEGYSCYLDAHDLTPNEIEELMDRILEFTQEPALQLRLEIIKDELIVSERQ